METPAQKPWSMERTSSYNHETTDSVRSSANFYDAEENIRLSGGMEQAKAVVKKPTPPLLDDEYQSSEESLSPALHDEVVATKEDQEHVVAENGSAAEESDSDDEDFAVIEVVEAKPFKIERAVAVNVAASGKANVVKVPERWSGFRGRHSQRYGSQSSTSTQPQSAHSQSPIERTASPVAIGAMSPSRTPRPRLDTSASHSSNSSATQTGASEGKRSPSDTIASESSDESLQFSGTTAGPVDPFAAPIMTRAPTAPSQLRNAVAPPRHSSASQYDVLEGRHSRSATISSRFNETVSQSRSSSMNRQENLETSRHSRSGTISSRYNESISQSRSSSKSRPATPQSSITRAFTDTSLSRGPSSATSFSAGTSLSRGPSSSTAYSTSLSREASSATNYSTNSFAYPHNAATNHSFLEMDPYHLPQSQNSLPRSNTRSKLRHVSSKLVASLNGPKSPASEGPIPVDDKTVNMQRRRSVAAASAPEMTAQNAQNAPFFFSQRARDEWYRRNEEKHALQTHDEKIPVPVIPRNKNPPPRSAGSASISSSSTSSTTKSLRFPRMLARGAGDRAPMPDLPPCPTGYDPFVPELTTTTSIVSGGSVKKREKGSSSKPKGSGISWGRN